MTDLNSRQLHNIGHALGINQGGKEYRNHFCTGPGCSNWDDWNDLVEKGFAIRHDPKEWLPDYTFRVTDAGREAYRKEVLEEAND